MMEGPGVKAATDDDLKLPTRVTTFLRNALLF